MDRLGSEPRTWQAVAEGPKWQTSPGDPNSGAKKMLVVKSLGPAEGQLTCDKSPPTFHLKTPLLALPFAIKAKRDRQKEEVPVTSGLCEADHELHFHENHSKGLKRGQRYWGFCRDCRLRMLSAVGRGRGGAQLADWGLGLQGGRPASLAGPSVLTITAKDTDWTETSLPEC